MPADLQIIRASEFVCLDANEHLDFEPSRKALEVLALACQKRGLDCALLDLRGLPMLSKPHFTTAQVNALVGAFRDAGFTRGQRLAILYEHDVYGIIRNFTLFSRSHGLQVQTFLDYEKAMSWLSRAQGGAAVQPQGVQVAIARRKVKKSPRKSPSRILRARAPQKRVRR
jgi:hypothetical protein